MLLGSHRGIKKLFSKQLNAFLKLCSFLSVLRQIFHILLRLQFGKRFTSSCQDQCLCVQSVQVSRIIQNYSKAVQKKQKNVKLSEQRPRLSEPSLLAKSSSKDYVGRKESPDIKKRRQKGYQIIAINQKKVIEKW